MAVKNILKMGDARLLRQASPISHFGSIELKRLIIDMFDTMKAYDGIGLAAPQIGVNQQVIIFGFDDVVDLPETVLLNPILDFLTDEQENAWEGCLSAPGLKGLVPRCTHIRYRGFDPEEKVIEREAKGLHARVVQHEFDHLIGRLYPTRMMDMTQFGFTDTIFTGER